MNLKGTLVQRTNNLLKSLKFIVSYLVSSTRNADIAKGTGKVRTKFLEHLKVKLRLLRRDFFMSNEVVFSNKVI